MNQIISVVVCICVFALSGLADDIQMSEFVYQTVDEREIKVTVHYPPDWDENDQRSAIIFFFGGGWNGGSIDQFEFHANYLASRGMVSARADYRVKSRDGVTPDECVKDMRSAVRWMKKNADRLGIDATRLVTSGGSAGGHLAACAMIADSVEHEDQDLSISTEPIAMVLFNPILDFHIESLTKRLGDRRHLAGKISPLDALDEQSPPSIILFGTEDHYGIHGDRYWEKAETLGVRADQFLAEDMEHGFFNHSPWLERTLIAVDEFLVSLGLLSGEATIQVPDEEQREQQ